MATIRSAASAALVVTALAAPSFAQAPAAVGQAAPSAVAGPPVDPAKLRRNIYVMEGALARAVQFGAQDLNRKIRSALPDVMALSGEPQARGVYLSGYGIYFDVAVPVLNQVMITSLGRMLGPDDAMVNDIRQLKSYVQSEKNVATRAALETLITRLEMQLGPGPVFGPPDVFTAPGRTTPGTSSAAIVTPAPASADAAGPRLDRRSLQDPNAINRAYTESVQDALIETIIDQHTPLGLAIRPDEYLTIAARDNMQRDTLAPWDPQEEVVTVLLSFKGSDLAAYRAGQIDAAELKKRLEIREF